MRWSRLKKNINPDDISSPVVSPAAKPKSPPKERVVLREIKEEIKKEKRAGRKAKIRAEYKIGALVKNEEEEEEEEDEEVRASAGLEDNSYITNETDSLGQIKVVQSNIGLTAFKMDDGYMNNTVPNAYPALTNGGGVSDLLEAINQPAFGLFRLSPPLPNPFPEFVSTPQPSITPTPEVWGNTITIKHEPEPNPTITVNPMLITSPVSPSALFPPGSPIRGSASPPKVGMKQLTHKWHPINNSRVRKTRGRSQKNVDDESFEI